MLFSMQNPPSNSSASTAPDPSQIWLRPWFIGMLAFQGILVMARFMLDDHFGALLMGLVTTVGALAICTTQGVDALYCLYYGIMSFVSAFMDLVLIFERWSQARHSLFGIKAPLVHNLSSAIIIISAIAQVISAAMSYRLYQAAPNDDLETIHLRYNREDAAAYQAAMLQSQAAAMSHPGANTMGTEPQGPKPFQGQAHRL